jgi:hypothetical protein
MGCHAHFTTNTTDEAQYASLLQVTKSVATKPSHWAWYAQLQRPFHTWYTLCLARWKLKCQEQYFWSTCHSGNYLDCTWEVLCSNLGGALASLTKEFSPPQANARIVPPSCHDRFLTFPIHQPSHNLLLHSLRYWLHHKRDRKNGRA